MHLSGILVLTEPARLAACRAELDSLTGVEVHHEDAATGRLIAVLETATLAGQQHGLRRIQELPSVHLAALVEHRIDAPPAAGSAASDTLEPGTD